MIFQKNRRRWFLLPPGVATTPGGFYVGGNMIFARFVCTIGPCLMLLFSSRCILLLALLLWLLLPAAGFAQATQFESFTIEQGLSQGMIFDICQTRDGFLWVATKDGLNRYDGYNIFTHNPFAPYSLAENTLVALFEDHSAAMPAFFRPSPTQATTRPSAPAAARLRWRATRRASARALGRRSAAPAQPTSVRHLRPPRA